MNNADLAIIISVFSVCIATLSIGWNIYRDVILKPKVIVTTAVKVLYGGNSGPSPDYIGITATNHGPGSVILNTLVLKKSSVWRRILRKEKYGIVVRASDNPYSTNLPKKIEVGEGVDLFLDYNADCFLKEPFTHLGISDTFGRTNWAPTRSMKKLRAGWLDKFSENS